MDIDKMPAGREMDALIAKKVMGWKIGIDPAEDGGASWFELKCGDWIETEYYPDNFKPSEDIAAAWEVVEKMEPVRIPPQACHPLLLQKEWWSDEWMAQVGSIKARAETAQLAICRAALKALEA